MLELLSTKKIGKGLSIVLVVGLLLICVFFIATTFITMRNRLETDVLSRLESIARTVSLNIDGDTHQRITVKYGDKKSKDGLETDEDFISIHKILKETKEINKLETDIYTLIYDRAHEKVGTEAIKMGILSSDKQYFLDDYVTHPESLKSNFNVGGVITGYKTDSGDWLSAFAPIKNSKGETVAVVQVDEKFNVFLAEVRSDVIMNGLVSFIIISVIASLMFYLINKLIRLDQVKSDELKHTHKLLSEQNKKITDSINYAQRIQNSIVTSEQELESHFPESFIYWKAKDVVSGDFTWTFKDGDNIYIAVIDCTGHGVPGAMMSFIGYFLLNQILTSKKNILTGEILDFLHQGVVTTLKQEEKNISQNDGMDVAFCKINLSKKKLWFSGAHRPLYLVNNENELKEFKGTRKSIGGTHYDKLGRDFETIEVDIEENDSFYFFSDGYPDQTGGAEGRKYGSKKVRELIKKIGNNPMEDVKPVIESEFNIWKKEENQLDDVLFIGIRPLVGK